MYVWLNPLKIRALVCFELNADRLGLRLVDLQSRLHVVDREIQKISMDLRLTDAQIVDALQHQLQSPLLQLDEE